MDELNLNTQQILFFWISLLNVNCEKCGGESRINSYDEIWCKNCAMLTRACKCPMVIVNNKI